MISVLVACATLLAPTALFAEQQSPELTIAPVVIDEKAKPRYILKRSVTITNTSDRRLNLYPSVNDIHFEEGEQEFVRAQNADERKDSLANWIELSRGVVELEPGEEKTVPFVIRVNLNAVPGSYHAEISFSDGSSRDGAEAKRASGITVVNVEVQADIKEEMQLSKFSTDNVYLAGDDVLFNVQLENIGNQDLEPRGEIRVYNRRGEEVASLEVNADGKIVSPDQMTQLASVWNAVEGIGRFKAFLTLDYGKTQTASVQDTVYFWIIPWKQLLMLFTGSIVLLVFFALYFHRWFERRHHARLALAGGPAVAPGEPVPHPSGVQLLPGFGIASRVVGMTFAIAGAVVHGSVSVVRGATGVFGKFRRRSVDEPAEISEPIPASQPQRAPAVAPHSPQVRQEIQVSAPVPSSSASGTIDLRARKGNGGGTVSQSQGLVINLKKKE